MKKMSTIKFPNQAEAYEVVDKVARIGLDNKSDMGHIHVRSEITDFAHEHDERYYTETEIDQKLETVANTYETQTDAQAKFDEAKTYAETQASGAVTSAGSAADTKISTHNTSDSAHNDIRNLITGLTDRLNTLANSDDTTLDQMAEVVAYIKSNRTLIESVTTNKVNVSDIIDNLETNVADKPLSAAQGVALKTLIDAIEVPVQSVNGKTGTVSLGASDVGADASGTASSAVSTHNSSATAHSDIRDAIPTKVSDLTNDSGFTSNTGTITGVSANGTSVATSGVANIPAASTSAYGVTKLSTSTSGTSTVLAATESAVKVAYDKGVSAETAASNAQTTADAALPKAGGTMTGELIAGTQTESTSLLRNSKLVSAETNPTVNGEICWTYE